MRILIGAAPWLLLACAARSAEVRPAILEWQVGLNLKEGPSGLVETILPATHEGREVWRVVHRDPDPTEAGALNAYDLFDVDRSTLAPVRSVSSQEGLYLALAFAGDRVTIEKRAGAERQTTEVRARSPMPEGPGLDVLLAALPLAVGYARTFTLVDRWAQDDATRVKEVVLTVERRTQIQTRLGLCDVLDVLLAPRDGSFQIRTWVRAEPPRYPVKVEYVRGDLDLVSEVTRMVVTDVPRPCGGEPARTP